MSGMTQANSRYVKKRWKTHGKSIMKFLKFELFGMQKACQRKSQLKVQPADQYRNYHKNN